MILILNQTIKLIKTTPCISLDILEETNLNSAIRFLTPMETQHSI